MLDSGFQSPGFRIPQAKNSWIPESRFPYMGRRIPTLESFNFRKKVIRSNYRELRNIWIKLQMWKGRELSRINARFKESFVRAVGEIYCTLRVLYWKASSIISNDLIHVMWFYRIFLSHRFSGAALCPKYDTRRGVILSLHAGILPYLRILVFLPQSINRRDSIWWLKINGSGCCCLVRYVDWYPKTFL